MNKLAKVERFFNNLNSTSDDELFVGVEVHKKSYHVALFLNDMPAIDFRMTAEPTKLYEKLQPMARSIKNIVYEAGPTGYGLARDLIKNKLAATVVATYCNIKNSSRSRPYSCLSVCDRAVSLQGFQFKQAAI